MTIDTHKHTKKTEKSSIIEKMKKVQDFMRSTIDDAKAYQ